MHTTRAYLKICRRARILTRHKRRVTFALSVRDGDLSDAEELVHVLFDPVFTSLVCEGRPDVESARSSPKSPKGPERGFLRCCGSSSDPADGLLRSMDVRVDPEQIMPSRLSDVNSSPFWSMELGHGRRRDGH